MVSRLGLKYKKFKKNNVYGHILQVPADPELRKIVRDDPKYNHTVGISAGLNIGAHLDYGTLSVMCTEPMANSTHNILQTMFPITPTTIGPGTVVGVERTVTKVSGSYCWSCTAEEELTAHIYDREGFFVRTQHASARIELELDTDAGQIAVVSHSKSR